MSSRAAGFAAKQGLGKCSRPAQFSATLPAMNIRILLGSVALVTLGAIAPAAEKPVTTLIKNDLVSLQGKKLHRFDDAPLAATKYFAVYYSASWCGPCKAFTPKLVEFYNRIKPANPNFELIFVSSDNSEPEMEAYMRTDKMPWPALNFRKASGKHPMTEYAGPGIPCLVLLDEKGKVLSHSYVGTSYVGPTKVMNDIETTLKSAAPAAGTPPPGATPVTGVPAAR